MSNGDRSFYTLMFLFIAGLIGSWVWANQELFFRDVYFVKAENAGSLVEGNPVKINGVEAGSILDAIELGHQKVLLKIGMNRGVRIAKNSDVNIRSVGMVGKRILAVEVLAGSDGFYAPGDTLVSGYHPGPVHLVVFAQQFFAELVAGVESIKKGLAGTIQDSLVNAEFSSLLTNVTKVSRSANRLKKTLTQELPSSFSVVEGELKKMQASLGEMREDIRPLEKGFAELAPELQNFDRSLGLFMKQIDQRLLDYKNKPNSVRLLFNDAEWLAEFDLTMNHLDSVLDTLLTGNIRLNADIF